ncbi:ABC transporter substrate-binding protein [Ideonella sp. BN130291]|uniref:ABC transporter substrate-binding protein n=1 Tax=Ideonella sp. BN130291 TaxID=3112940 RepID=UPI002E26B722|nr:ABC transporter substrate-binding protein [Ideonella sp. BN130291]
MKRRDLLLSAPALWAGALSGLHGNARAEAGVVTFGQSASLSGGQAKYGTEIRDGIAAAFAAANKAEGTKGLRFELQTLDDGGVKDRCVGNVKQLIDSGVAALVGLTSGAAAEASLPAIEQAQIALLGTASGNMGIRQNAKAPACHVRAGYDVEYKRMVTYIRDFGLRRVGYVYLGDTSKANLAAMTQALDAVGVKPAAAIGIDRNAKSLQPVADQLMAANLDCVLFTTNAAPIIKITEHMAAAKYPGMFFASSFAGQDLVDGLANSNRSVVMSLVVPRPTALGVAVVAQAKNDFAAFGNGTKLGVTTLEGYIAGRVAVEAARQAAKGGTVGRARLKDTLANLRADLGGYRVAFGPDNTTGSQYVEMVVIDRFGRLVG